MKFWIIRLLKFLLARKFFSKFQIFIFENFFEKILSEIFFEKYFLWKNFLSEIFFKNIFKFLSEKFLQENFLKKYFWNFLWEKNFLQKIFEWIFWEKFLKKIGRKFFLKKISDTKNFKIKKSGENFFSEFLKTGYKNQIFDFYKNHICDLRGLFSRIWSFCIFRINHIRKNF